MMATLRSEFFAVDVRVGLRFVVACCVFWAVGASGFASFAER
jgi:hypothetical protein